jgi:lipid-A-disaccharide synthase
MTLIYVIAGEASGDVLGARLIHAIMRRRPEIRFAGIGGSQMAAHGVDSLFPIRDLALMGLLEVLPRLFQLRRRLHQTVADIAARRPDVVVTIDSPGFTLRVLKAIRPLGIHRVHYVAPQAWAWRESRVRHYPGLWEQLLCLLPFEPDFFAGHGLPATFVGHPVLESGADTGDATRFRAQHGIDPNARILTVMPGSRRTEVSRLLPILEATLRRLPKVVPVVPLAGPVADTVRQGTRANGSGLSGQPVERGDREAVGQSAICLDHQPDRRSGGDPRVHSAGLHAGPAGCYDAYAAGRSRGDQGAARGLPRGAALAASA